MEIEWDAEKDAANRAKHGISLATAAGLDWRMGKSEADVRNYGEMRWILYSLLNGRLMVCVYTLRGTRYRIISLRKANSRERMQHGQT